jgi:hypothetical protein
MEQADEGMAGESSPRRVRRSPEQWRALIEAQPTSGQGVEEYCSQHQVTSSCFYRWRRFLTGTTGATSPWANLKSLPAIKGFAAVHLKQDQSEPRSLPGDSMRLRLAGGRELILPVMMPIPRLVELLVALEGMPKPAKPERDV